MNALPTFPLAVHRYVASVFGGANRRICEKIARVPNCSEPSLDLTFIEHLTQNAGPRVVAPGWAVRIDVHYLGGLRHFYQWEIADIGVLLFAKRGPRVIAKKVAVLQSKRLYPDNQGIVGEAQEDYRIGFGNLLPSATSSPSIALKHTFQFTKTSSYKALRVDDNQYKAIEAYEAQQKFPVHYFFYNPWVIPASYSYPISVAVNLGRKGNGGCRVIPSNAVPNVLAGKPKDYSPTFQDLAIAVSQAAAHAHGWRLENFVSNLLMKCREGHSFQSLDEENIFTLFNRRSGPIAAALAVTIEQFED